MNPKGKTYIYTYISHAALLSGYVVVTPGISQHKQKCTNDITAFRLFDMTHRKLLIFSREADWGIRLGMFYAHSFIHLKSSIDVSDWWTSHLVIWSKHWIFPPTKLGKRGVGNEVGREKMKILHPQFCELPAHPPHAWREMSHELKLTDFFLNVHHLRNATCIVSETLNNMFMIYVWPLFYLKHFFLKRRSFIAVH